MRKICLRCGAKFGSQAEYCPHDGSLLATDDQIADPLLGTVLLEQFRIEEQIGTGGMGTVYRAHQPSIGRDVAIKVLRAELARDAQAVARFEREARLATSLDHPNLVRVFLSGQLSDGRLYIVMELLKGRSLSDELEREGVPSIERALIMIMKLCAGLGAVHSAGIVHRDIKPENVYLVQRGRDNDFVKLVDFGVARVLEADGVGPTTTQSGRVFGTATYISPEAATGDETDLRSDIYSLGVLSYQLLTGELPFRGSTAGAILMQHVHNEPPPLQTVGRGADVPIEVADVIMRSLSKDPEARQQTLAKFLDSLAEAAGRAGLLQDARTLLLGTIWGDDLAAPGSYLAELLGASSPSSLPPALDETQPVPVKRDPEEEALLSSAPKPFGTTSYDLAPAPGRKKKRRYGWLWVTLGVIAVVLIGAVAGTWLKQRKPWRIVVEQPPAVTPTEEQGAPVADVGTSLPVPEPAQDAPPAEDVTPPVEEPKSDDQASEIPRPPPEAKPQPKPRKRRKPKATQPASAPASAPANAPELEPDEGIDWTVPDFPEESPVRVEPVETPSVDAAPAESPAPAEPPPPTGTPDAPARNPVVIDEPPP